MSSKVNPDSDSTLIFVRKQVICIALSTLAAITILSGFRLAGEQPADITQVSLTHRASESTLSLASSTPISMHSALERTAKGWILRITKARIIDNAIDYATMNSKLAFKWDNRASECVITIVSTFDTIIAKRISPKEISYTATSKSSQKNAATPPANTLASKGPWSLDVIVIDPGHGGQDAGAEGVNGAYEKNVVLAIGRKLRDILKKALPTTKVVMTRETDVFIELYRRTEIANAAGGKLFVSIHCNSMPTKPHPAHGCETYILRPGRNDDAARVAQRENASVSFEKAKRRYEGMTEDQIIVATMAQRSFVKLSETFAVKIQKEMTSGGSLTDRGVSQAGFFVLVGASMPNVLVETGFLSNTKDAAYLASASGQTAIAQGLAKAIQAYAREYQQSLKH